MVEKLLRLPDVMDMTGKSRSAIYMDMAANPPQFPRSVPIGSRAKAWKLSEIQNWIKEQSSKGAA
ncbi:MAG: AlpA family phage regulatory protein [Xanthomonadales bacterium]|nr:AlpA family phage regulatory protein [Xanthomonadales bacterium]